MKVAVEHIFTGTTKTTEETYDSTVTTLGTLMKQYTGPNPEDKYVSTVPSAMINLIEASGFSYYIPHVIQRSPTIYWIFMATNATAAVTRNLSLFEFDSDEASITHKGYVTLSGTTITGNKIIRALRAFVYTHTTGTVSTSGSSTTLTGSGTGFQSERIATGARIGFGSTDPLQITDWYEISSITNDTTLTLDRVATVAPGTSYVIEEIRLLVACTNATLTNGGPHLIKGLNFNTFTPSGTVIAEATNVDNIRASYLLTDDATTTLTNMFGLASDEMSSFTDHTIFGLQINTTTSVRAYKFNIRAALTVSSGRSTSAFEYRTDAQTTTGTISQINNGRMFTVNHLSANGEKSVWFATTTRIYRARVSDIVENSSTWISDSMSEIPVGGATTYVLTSSMNQVDYSQTIDRVIVPTGVGRFGIYVGEYDTGNTRPFERIAGILSGRTKLSTTQAGATDALFPAAVTTVWTESGYMFAAPSVVTTGLNWLRAFPFSADGYYASSTNQRIITPKMSTIDATRLYRVYVDHEEYSGSYELGFPPDTYRIYYRTSGIDDNTGTWIPVPVSGDISGTSPSQYIQFMLELDTLGETSVPAKIFSICCVYEDSSQELRYQPSLTFSSAANRRFAWKQVATWGSNIPNLRIKITNAANEFLVLDDTIDLSASGTFEYSSDNGVTWLPWDNTEDQVGNYIRYTADTLPNNISVRTLLTQA
jgi:hypothetical protein